MAKKTFSRNEISRFIAGFYVDKEHTIPVVPLTDSYPTYSIVNPEGEVIQSGTALPYSSNGNYEVEFTIPDNAMLSTDLDSWYINWTMVSSTNQQLQCKENFLVVDARVETPIDTSIITVIPEGKPVRLINYFETDPLSIEVNVYPAKNTVTPIVTKTKELAELKGPINENGHIGYYVDVDTTLSQGDYLVIWSYRNTELSDESREFRTLRVIRTTVLRYVDQLRILIDRFQKRQSAPNAYSDSDLIEFLYKGLEMVNSWYPTSMPPITWDSIDNSNYPMFVISCAALWGLRSQYLLETDLAFSFCIDEQSYIKTNRGLVKIKSLSGQDLYNPDIEEVDIQRSLSYMLKEMNNILNSINEGSFSFYSSKYFLDTPLGLQHPSIVFNLGKRIVRKIITNTGTKLVCTNNHPTMTLSTNLDFIEKRTDDIKEGEYLVIDTTPEEEIEWETKIAQVQCDLGLPCILTKELAIVLGYLTFCDLVDNKIVIDCLNDECKEALKFNLKIITNGKLEPEDILSNECFISSLSFLGVTFNKNKNVCIPPCIMSSSLSIAKEYIQAVYKVIGTFSDDALLFTTEHHELREDLKLLLLRYGVIGSHNSGGLHTVRSLKVSGNYLNIYNKKICIDEVPQDAFFYDSEMDDVPSFIKEYLENQNVKICDALTYSNLSSYIKLCTDEEERGKLLNLITYGSFRFEPVIKNIVIRKPRVVADPVLPTVFDAEDNVCFLSNYFVCSGVVTHNSGQTTTIDYDRTGNIDTQYQSLLDFVNNNLTKAKIAVTRSAGIGSVAVRPYSVHHNARNRVIQYQGPNSGIGNNIWDLMVVLGL